MPGPPSSAPSRAPTVSPNGASSSVLGFFSLLVIVSLPIYCCWWFIRRSRFVHGQRAVVPGAGEYEVAYAPRVVYPPQPQYPGMAPPQGQPPPAMYYGPNGQPVPFYGGHGGGGGYPAPLPMAVAECYYPDPHGGVGTMGPPPQVVYATYPMSMPMPMQNGNAGQGGTGGPGYPPIATATVVSLPSTGYPPMGAAAAPAPAPAAPRVGGVAMGNGNVIRNGPSPW